MAAEIALRPNDDRGREILDELEEQTEMKPMELWTRTTPAALLQRQQFSRRQLGPMLDRIRL